MAGTAAPSAAQAEALLGALRSLAIGVEYLRSIPANAASSRTFAPFIAQWDRWTSGSEVVGDDELSRAQAALALLIARLQSLPGDAQRRRAAARILQYARDLQGQIVARQNAIRTQRGALAQRVGTLVGHASRHVGDALRSAGSLGIVTALGGGIGLVVAAIIAILILRKG